MRRDSGRPPDSRVLRSLARIWSPWPWVAAVVSGLGLTTCFPPLDLGPLCWLALTPWIAAVWFGTQPGQWFRQAMLGYVAGLAFFWTAFYWLTTVTVIGWFALAFYLALYFAFWGWFLGSVARPLAGMVKTRRRGEFPAIMDSRRNLQIAFSGAAAWVLHEAARGIAFSGFGWNGPGVALHQDPHFRQIAELTGVAGLSFLIVFVNLMVVLTVWRLVTEVGRVRLRPHWDFSVTVVLVMAAFLYGVSVFQREAPPSQPLRLAAVQANIPQNEKFDRAFEQKIFDRYRELTGVAAALDPDLLIWPEAATPRAMYADRVNRDFVLEMAALGRFGLLLGTLDFDEAGDYNVAVLLAGDSPPQVYRKIHLVPFGEFIPFRHTFPLFAAIAGDLVPGDFLPGKERVVFKLPDPEVRMAPLICFEDTLGDLTRGFVQRGADMLVTVTNDGWFLRSAGAEQHLANSIWRAVENRRPLVRCANTGVTAIVDHHGRVTHKLMDEAGSHFIEGVLSAEIDVPVGAGETFYTRHGEVFSMGASAVAVIVMAWHFVRRERRE